MENSGHCVGCNGDYTNDYWRMLETFFLSAIHEGEAEYERPSFTWTTNMVSDVVKYCNIL